MPKILSLALLSAASLASPPTPDRPNVPGQSDLYNPCIVPSFAAKHAWCDPARPTADRVELMIAAMTTSEKIASLGSSKNAVPSLSLPSYNWRSEGEHGVSYARFDKTAPYSTSFPFESTAAMAFNRSLWAAMGRQIGEEARALANLGNAYSTWWFPVVNLGRDPRWGRNFEVPGEDPVLTGEYASSFIRAFQESELDSRYLQASACCKHYAANNVEKSTEAGVQWSRYDIASNVTMQDLVDSYLPAFQACVERGRVSGLMCAYSGIVSPGLGPDNSPNTRHSCANKWLLQDLARDTWQFDGYVVADCDAAGTAFSADTETPEEAVRNVLRAGTDIDCGTFITDHAQSALDKGVITIDDIDARLRKIFRLRLRLGHFEPAYGPLDGITPAVICSPQAKALAKDATTQSVALLKNTANTLPLDAATLQQVVLIGPNANLSKTTNFYGGPRSPCDMRFDSCVDAISTWGARGFGGGFDFKWSSGVSSVQAANATAAELAAAVALARDADVVIMAVGTDLTMASEGHDATSIVLSGGQQQLVEAVAAAAKAPVVVVTLTGVPLDLTPLIGNPKVGAVLHAGVPAVQTAGIADVIFGEASPAGRMVFTSYPAAFADSISIFDLNMRPGPSTFPRPDCDCAARCCGNQCLCRNTTGEPVHYCECGSDPACKVPPLSPHAPCPRGTNPGRTHRFYTGKAVVPFGFGLSYTSFKYSIVQSTPSPGQRLSLDRLRAVLRKRAVSAGAAEEEEEEEVVVVAGDKEEAAGEEARGELDAASASASFVPRSLLDEDLAAAGGAPLARFVVNVTNTGTRDADDVVLGFLEPPGAGTGGIPRQTLFGFERVRVGAGETVSVLLYPDLLTFSQVDALGRRRALPGEYTVRFGLKETAPLGMGLVERMVVAE